MYIYEHEMDLKPAGQWCPVATRYYTKFLKWRQVEEWHLAKRHSRDGQYASDDDGADVCR